jgi:hypothetical protein
MILTSFLRSDIPHTVPPSFSGLILWNRLTNSVLNVYNIVEVRVSEEYWNNIEILLSICIRWDYPRVEDNIGSSMRNVIRNINHR